MLSGVPLGVRGVSAARSRMLVKLTVNSRTAPDESATRTVLDTISA